MKNKNARIYVAGHRGLVGSALIRKLKEAGYSNIITKSHKELDLTQQKDTEEFFEKERPEYVFLAAAKVGGILANSTYKAQFIYENMMISANVIHASYKYGVKKLLNLGSSCIYPKFASQPLKEKYLLTGPLEPTNEPYAIAKISAIKLCRYYNEQYGTDFISVMPSNLYGPNDNFDLDTSHVLPALIRKFHLAKLLKQGNFSLIKKDFLLFGIPGKIKKINSIESILGEYKITPHSVTLWGTGNPYREFLYVEDLAEACIFLMQNYSFKEIGEFVNIGTGRDIQIRDLAELIKEVVGFEGEIKWDKTKPDGTPRKLLDTTRAKRLGWRANTSLKKGIEKTYAWYLKRLNK